LQGFANIDIFNNNQLIHITQIGVLFCLTKTKVVPWGTTHMEFLKEEPYQSSNIKSFF
jgi:hypothetical protein